MQKKKISFDILDSIRGIAAFYVAIAHCRGVLWMGGSVFLREHPRASWDFLDYLVFGSSMLTRLAVELVIVFFVLSGFSIAHSLSGERSILKFYKRRLIRIYPSYLAALVWAGVIYLITLYLFPQWYDGSLNTFSFVRTVEMNDYFEPSRVALNLFYMPGDGFITPFWSLTYEVIFYLLAPFLLRNVPVYLIVSTLFFLTGLCFQYQFKTSSLPLYLREYVFTYNMFFAIGVALYYYWEKVMSVTAYLGKVKHLGALGLILVVLYGVNFYFGHETIYSFIIAALMGCLLITYFLIYQVRIKWLMRIGSYSYTLYITHFATIYLYLAACWMILGFNRPYISNYLVWIFAVPVCLGIAYIQYRLVEQPSKKLLIKFRSS